MIFFDTETCGLHGPIVLLQWALDDGPINLVEIWKRSIRENINFIKFIANHEGGIIGFNLAFDWFHICKLYTTLEELLKRGINEETILEDCIIEFALAEPAARDGSCVKPIKAHDIMLHARRGPYQSLMDRKDIKIKKIPSVLAYELAKELEKSIPLNPIYFANRKDKTTPIWQVFDRRTIKNGKEIVDPNLKDIVLKFKASSGLKALATDALKLDPNEVIRWEDQANLSKDCYPVEFEHAPFALAIAKITKEELTEEEDQFFARTIITNWIKGNIQDLEELKKKRIYVENISQENEILNIEFCKIKRIQWNRSWPEVIHYHINHWNRDVYARQYASDDVKYTRDLYRFFGSPSLGDDDSELACMVGAVRWKGMKIDIEGIKELKKKAEDSLYYDFEIVEAEPNKISDECAQYIFNKENTLYNEDVIRSIYDKTNKLTAYIRKKVPTAPAAVKQFIREVLTEEEKIIFDQFNTTKKVFLQQIAKGKVWSKILCPICGDQDELKTVCKECDGVGWFQHPASIRAEMVLNARFAQDDIELYDKLLQAGRFHVSVKVTGTLSGRMSGGSDRVVENSKKRKDGGINPQGIKHTYDVRSKFPLSFDNQGYILSGGDFDGFEVTIADKVFGDENLRKDMLSCTFCNYVCTQDEYLYAVRCPSCFKCRFQCKKCKHKNFDYYSEQTNVVCPKCGEQEKVEVEFRMPIHALMAQQIFPDKTYEEIIKSKKTSFDMYDYGKRSIFSTLYGGNANTLVTRLEISLEIAEKAFNGFLNKYPGIIRSKMKVRNDFCSMRQPNGIGTQVEWHEPKDFVESMLGFRRYFTLENKICKALFNIANNPPKVWRNIKVNIVRNIERGIQTASGAIQSALYAAAFAIQSHNERAANNHLIQSTGATITKAVQRKIWDIQPSGINEWLVQPMNIHDEIMCPTKDDPKVKAKVKQVVDDTVSYYRKQIPLLKMEWKTELKSWGDK